jgi:hypothetical protein
MQSSCRYRRVAGWKGTPVVALSTLLFVSVCPSQQSSQSDQSSNSPPHTGSHQALSNEQNALPDAPSASRPLPNDVSFDDRLRHYRHSLTNPYTYVGTPIGAAIGQWENEPPEWDQGAKGYFRRFGSGVGRHIISETIRFGVAAADGEDPRYHPARAGSVWNRGLHAASETFTTRTVGGTRIPAFSRFAGIYGAAVFSNIWYPNSRTTTGYVLRRGSTALASNVLLHLVEEFFPMARSKSFHETSSQPNGAADTTIGGEDKERPVRTKENLSGEVPR